MTTDETPPSLLAGGLDIPSLNHDPKVVSSENSSSSSSASPTATTPQDLDDDITDDVSYPKASPPDSAKRPRSMSGFDTPIASNHKIITSVGPDAQPVPMGNPFENRSNSVHSMGESSLNTSSSLGTNNSSFLRLTEAVPRHSDFTIPVSNILKLQAMENGSTDPPEQLQPAFEKRSILGDNVAKKYNCSEQDRRSDRRSLDRNGRTSPSTITYGSIPPPMAVVNTPGTMTAMTPLSAESTSFQKQGDSTTPRIQSPPTTALHTRSSSRMIPRIVPTKQYADYDDYYDDIVEEKNCNDLCKTADPELRDLLPKNHPSRQHFSQSTHAQALLVGLAFMVVWLPNNAMAPNLTQMAEYYGMNDAERDLYLGSYCALALGVFCLPISGLIGFCADFHSRKDLFIACCGLGALMSAWTGWAPNYWSLFLSRLFSGGIMSGSVPVAFSFMGDLFSKEERNAASSGMTSMMGLGILLGQLYAGEIGPSAGWQHPFFVSAYIQLGMAIVVALWVDEPVRGGKEAALKELLKSGKKYEKQLTMQGFIHEMTKNASMWILIWQGFVTSLPWGICFVFLNDYLSQEKGFSVEEATFLVLLFGLGSAVGGISGGVFGQMFMRGNRANLPLYMAASTFVGIIPFLLLLNSDYPDHNGYRAKLYSVLGGLIANLPSVNIRPCIINVNPPESRGAALTTANLFVTLGRGIGPSFVTIFGSIFDASRQTSFNVSLCTFWTVAAIQLVFLANTLPKDQDAVEEKLMQYAMEANQENGGDDIEDQVPLSPLRTEKTALLHPKTPDRLDPTRRDEENFYQSIISSPPGQYMVIDGKSAQESLEFIKLGIQEFGDELILHNAQCRGCDTISPCESQDDVKNTESDIADMAGQVLFSQEDTISEDEMERRRQMWVRRQRQKQTD